MNMRFPQGKTAVLPVAIRHTQSGKTLYIFERITGKTNALPVFACVFLPIGSILDDSVLIVNMCLNKKERLNIVMDPVAIEGSVITIRRFLDNCHADFVIAENSFLAIISSSSRFETSAAFRGSIATRTGSASRKS